MQDDSTSSPQEPNTVSIAQGVDDLSDGIQYGVSSFIRGERDPATGRMIITYSLSAKPNDPNAGYTPIDDDQKTLPRESLPEDTVVEPLKPVEGKQHLYSGIETALAEIESLSNVKFVRVEHVDKREGAHLQFFEGDITGQGGHATPRTNPTAPREIFINSAEISSADDVKRGSSGYATILHEILHAMGASHPGSKGEGGKSGGDNPLYDDIGTVLSYNNRTVNGLGVYDVSFLWEYYGPPPTSEAEKTTSLFKVSDLTDRSVLYAPSGSADIDIRKRVEGYINADLSQVLPGQDHAITGQLGSEDIRLGFADGTRVRNFSAAASRAKIRVTGNELPNKIEGGEKRDFITPRGGADILSGGDGGDVFIFDDQSGRGNKILDFRANEDRISSDGLWLLPRKDEKTGFVRIDFLPKDAEFCGGEPVSDVLLEGVTPEHFIANLSLGHEAFWANSEYAELPTINALRALGWDINKKDSDGSCLLHVAAACQAPASDADSYPYAVRFLIDSGAEVTARDARGNTALYYANDTAVFSMLLREGDFTAEDKGRALAKAPFDHQRKEIIEVLLKDPEITADHKKTAFQKALEFGCSPSIFELFLEQPDMTAEHKFEALKEALHAWEESFATRLLEEPGLTADHKGKVCVEAAHAGRADIVKLLLDSHNIASDYKNEAIIKAASKVNTDGIEFLTQKNIVTFLLNQPDVTADSKGAALVEAASNGNEMLVKLLLQQSDITTEYKMNALKKAEANTEQVNKSVVDLIQESIDKDEGAKKSEPASAMAPNHPLSPLIDGISSLGLAMNNCPEGQNTHFAGAASVQGMPKKIGPSFNTPA